MRSQCMLGSKHETATLHMGQGRLHTTGPRVGASMRCIYKMRNLSTFVTTAVLIMVLVACDRDQLTKKATPNATDVRPTAVPTPVATDQPPTTAATPVVTVARPTAEATVAPSPDSTEGPAQELVSTLRSTTKERAAPTTTDADDIRWSAGPSRPLCAATPPSPSIYMRP